MEGPDWFICLWITVRTTKQLDIFVSTYRRAIWTPCHVGQLHTRGQVQKEEECQKCREFCQAVQSLFRMVYPESLDVIRANALTMFLENCSDSADFRIAVKPPSHRLCRKRLKTPFKKNVYGWEKVTRRTLTSLSNLYWIWAKTQRLHLNMDGFIGAAGYGCERTKQVFGAALNRVGPFTTVTVL